MSEDKNKNQGCYFGVLSDPWLFESGVRNFL